MIVRSALVVVALVIAACGESGRGREAASDVTSSEAAGRSAAALPAGVRTFVIVPAESKASYVADEELFALALTKFGLPAGWSKVVGSTQAVEGRFQIDTGRPAAWLGDNEFTVRVNTFTTGGQYADAVAMDAAGNFVVVWTQNGGGSYGIFARRYDSSPSAHSSAVSWIVPRRR